MGVSMRGPSGDPSISPRYTASDWKGLAMATSAKPDWSTAVDIFADRINGRYMAQVKAMRGHAEFQIREWSGFAILALDCLVIETLGQFYCGFDESPNPRDRVLNSRGWSHMDFYIDYMRSIATLAQSGAFDTDCKKRLFYKHFRCGILHQAQTKQKSRVRYDEPVMVAFADNADHCQGLIVDRDKLHDALVEEIEAYKKVLLNGTNLQKRQNFIKKMGFIAP
jgi:hypothetical protein